MTQKLSNTNLPFECTYDFVAQGANIKSLLRQKIINEANNECFIFVVFKFQLEEELRKAVEQAKPDDITLSINRIKQTYDKIPS